MAASFLADNSMGSCQIAGRMVLPLLSLFLFCGVSFFDSAHAPHPFSRLQRSIYGEKLAETYVDAYLINEAIIDVCLHDSKRLWLSKSAFTLHQHGVSA
jgi:hypothetical protein